MKKAGQIVLLPFPFTDLSGAKVRPVLMLRKASDQFDDWLVCMVSSQLRQMDTQIDEIMLPSDADFATAGLKVPSVLRLSRLAVLDEGLLMGSLGTISQGRPNQPRRPHRRANPKARSPQDPQERVDAAAIPIPEGRMNDQCFRNRDLPWAR